MHLMRFVHPGVVCFLALSAANAALAEDLIIPGSGNPEYVLAQLASAFNQQQPVHRVTVPPSAGHAAALRDVEAGTNSVGRVGRPLTEAERSRGLAYVALGRDPVVFVGGTNVTLRSLTQAQILDLYRGKITDRHELGGKPGPIRAIGREPTNTARVEVSRVIKPFGNLTFGENVKIVHLDPQMIELLDRFPTSFGFLNQSALFACKTKVVRIALDGVEATPETVENGRYALSMEFGLIFKSNGLTPAGKAFLEFVKSPAGTRILRAHGVQPAVAAR